MAAEKVKHSSSKKGSKSGSKAGTGQSRTSARKKVTQDDFTGEILLWTVLAVSLLLFISNFGLGGSVGNAVSSFFFGVFGLVAYIFPVVLVVAVFFGISNRGNKIAKIKITAICIFILFFCMFLELIVNGKNAPGAVEVYKNCYAYKIGGGFIGGFFAKLCCPNFGVIGAYVIDVIGMIVCLVLITERSALRGVQKGGRKVYETAKEGNERYREITESRREERKNRKVSGVTMNTELLSKKSRDVSDEISEINIDEYLDIPEVKVSLTSKEEEDTRIEDVTSSVDTQSFDIQMPLEKKPEAEHVSVKEEKPRAKETESAVVMKETETAASKKEVEAEFSSAEEIFAEKREYAFPSVDLLNKPEAKRGDSKRYLQETAVKLQQTLKNFGVNVSITNVTCGPSVTRYEIQPEMGVKVSKIVNLADDIKLNLAAADIRMEAPIPGKAAIGIEVPNRESQMVSFRELVESQEFRGHASSIAFGVGKDIGGKVIVADIAKMPHLLIAGATGSGKSVCINTIIMSILYKADPRDVKLIMVDPKVVELSMYNGIPHLMIPVVTDPKKAAGALHWAVAEMDDRYKKFSEAGVRDLKGYNAKVESFVHIEGEEKPEKLPQIVIIVDELADLMMVAAGDVEDAICRLAQLARACGIHLIIATQRPSVNVITGLIKANMPSRIAFSVTSGIDSRTILDMVGAEKLLGKGDMLFHPQGMPKPVRVQGAFISDKEVSDVVNFLKEQMGSVSYNIEIEEKMRMEADDAVAIDGKGGSNGRDALFADAAMILIDKEKGSIGMLQRYFKIGFNRAARIMDQLEEAGIVGPEEGTKPRRVLMTAEQFEEFKKLL